MICTNCGSVLSDNAKFCTKCGNSLIKSDTMTEQPVSNTENSTQIPDKNTMSAQQPVCATIPNTQQPLYYINTGGIPKQNKTLKIVGGIVIAILIIIIISLVKTNSELNNQVSDYKYQIYQYENRDSIDKTIDAIDSWLDFLF